ncbi:MULTISPECIES: glycosyltransferase family 2 protein [unclassified Leisingera]|uniref:glycosyltransferase family 2 protein n=1 Tax=unclassified Leisingera TaxID=2614906 RepID=UPI001010F8C1|nr:MULTISPECIES: glycosyltransferase family 2 protein [unclassified Leisingera]MCF6429655.1 glycosyltransferase family 2 protein [Leisingera sp. MMG026]QAX31407.1 glycosyltransferase family 2 protein [Leisingera sp. NJS204]
MMRSAAADMPPLGLAGAYRMRWKRRRMLWRALRARRQMRKMADRTDQIPANGVLVFIVLRNEISRLPFFLESYRRLGAAHFLVVDNGSDDGSAELLADQPDVSVWQTAASYREARFGLDWLGWLLIRYGHGRWCLTVDADELLVYSGMEEHGLDDLTQNLEQQGRQGFGALMLDLYPKGPLGGQSYAPEQDPCEILQWFDAGPYRAVRQQPMGNLWVQGGARERVFFQEQPERSPTLNKLPLIRWNRRYAYMNSTHSLLPPQMNALYNGPGGTEPSGILLHTKFLPEIVSKSATEKQRQQHFHTPLQFDGYYDGISGTPDLWYSGSVRYQDPEQLAALGLMTPINW